MRCGDTRFFTKEHCEARTGTAPAYLAELVVHCLELVAQLSARGLAFRFKGGNSLLVLLEDPQRFSIDVDIVTVESKENLIALCEAIAAERDPFTKCEVRQHKTKPWLPMISFKLYFDSFFQQPDDAYVMLDCVLEPAPYAGQQKRVKCLDIYEAPQTVEVPSVDGLIADKLLTLGPATLGIPLGKGKEAQRLKHVFDVALLSRQPHDPAVIRTDIARCIEQENTLQKKTLTLAEITKDTLDFLGQPMAYETCPPFATIDPNTYMYEIAVGFNDFRQHLFRMDYTWELFKRDCAAVATALREAAGT